MKFRGFQLCFFHSSLKGVNLAFDKIFCILLNAESMVLGAINFSFCLMFFLYWIVPIRSLNGASHFSILLFLMFISILNFAYVISMFFLKKNNLKIKLISDYDFFAVNKMRKIGIFFFALSFIAILFLIYDRLFIRNIDYTMPLPVIRTYLNRDLKGHISSLYSFLGHIFVFSCLPAFLYNFFNSKRFGWGIILQLFFTFGVYFAYSYLLAGRSPLFFFISVLLVTVLLKFKIISFLKLSHSAKLIMVSFFIIFMSVAYAYNFFVIKSRIEQSFMYPYDYVNETIKDLGGELQVKDTYPRKTDFKDLNTYTQLISSSYLLHGIWKFSDINPEQINCKYTVRPFVGVIARYTNYFNTSCIFDGFFVPVPIFLYYDFGLIGFMLVVVFLGFSLALAKRFSDRGSYAGDILYVILVLFLLLSPFLYLFNSVPFILSMISCLFFFVSFKVATWRSEFTRLSNDPL